MTAEATAAAATATAAAAAAAADEAAAAEATAAAARAAAADQDEHGHDDIKWFLKGPGLNFVVLGIMTACSVQFAPRFDKRTVGGKRQTGAAAAAPWRRTKRTAVPLVSHVVGFVGLGIKYSGLWSAGVMIATGVRRKFLAERG
jgi:hypothetical protein